MQSLINPQTPRRQNPEFLRADAELPRQRDRERLKAIWRRLVIAKGGLCRDGKPGPRCVACILRGNT